MPTKPTHLYFDLVARKDFDISQFIVHSGVVDAYQMAKSACDKFLKDDRLFQLVFFWGPTGVGKSHLAQGLRQDLIKSGIEDSKIVIWDLTDQVTTASEGDNETTRKFVDCYQRLASSGGLFFVLSRKEPKRNSEDPHLVSRFLSGQEVSLAYPQEKELNTVLTVLLERHNLRLKDSQKKFLLRRLPLNPLSFATILDTIDHFSLSTGRPATQRVVRDAYRLSKQPGCGIPDNEEQKTRDAE